MNKALDRKGAILAISMWILAILSILAMGLGFRISIEARLCKYNLDQLRALYLAKAGYNRARALLAKKSLADPIPDSVRECGFKLSDTGDFQSTPETVFSNVKLGEGVFNVGEGSLPGIADEERRLNINKADEATLTRLIDACALDHPSEDASAETRRQIASSIVAWRTAADNPSEDNYYASLAHPYKRKKGDFTAVEELLLVRGVTPRIFDLIKNTVTVTSDKININTAPKEVLMAVGMTPNLAEQTIQYRNGPDNLPGTSDDVVFYDVNLEQLLPGSISEQENAVLSALKSLFITRSKYFRIDSMGRIDKSKAEKRIVCIVQKEEGKWPTLLSYREF